MDCPFQRVVNVLAVASAAVSIAVVGSVGYVYVNRTAIIEDIKEKALESVMGGGALGGLGGGSELPLGTNDLAPTTPQAQAPQDATGLPSAAPTF